ncbi:YetF domain-containing protein [Alkalihalophilus sp. As8PL]|uniref:YetF domain-containing protein n=1 Tax=Alkalihalophilus sp. As8PL TaxID=3237103 RepID=A0AB39BNK5_9BACI
MEPGFIDMSIKIIIGFFLLFMITRLLGKTTIRHLTPFDFVSAIVLSELLGNGIFETNVSIWYIIYVVLLWGFLMIIMEKYLLKHRSMRGLLEGKPSIIIRNGKIDREQLKQNRMNINQLLSSLRQSETFSLREVAYAILETNGSISILKKNKYQKVTLEDLNLPLSPTYLCTTLITDGEMIEANLKELGFTKDWLIQQLIGHGYTRVEDVLYADWIYDDGIYIVPYQSKQA